MFLIKVSDLFVRPYYRLIFVTKTVLLPQSNLSLLNYSFTNHNWHIIINKCSINSVFKFSCKILMSLTREYIIKHKKEMHARITNHRRLLLIPELHDFCWDIRRWICIFVIGINLNMKKCEKIENIGNCLQLIWLIVLYQNKKYNSAGDGENMTANTSVERSLQVKFIWWRFLGIIYWFHKKIL